MSSSYIVFPQIDPVIFSLGPLSVRWYGLMYLIAFLMANFIANRAADKPNSGWTRDQVSDLMFFGYKNKDGSFSVSHVGMVYDNKDGVVEMIHASSSNGVRIDKTDSNTWNSYWSRKFLFVKRILD
jgi:hypothetical protein